MSKNSTKSTKSNRVTHVQLKSGIDNIHTVVKMSIAEQKTVNITHQTQITEIFKRLRGVELKTYSLLGALGSAVAIVSLIFLIMKIIRG